MINIKLFLFNKLNHASINTFLIVIGICVFLPSCDGQSPANKATEFKLGKQTLLIPQEYQQYEPITADAASISFYAHFPGNTPLPAKISTLLKTGKAKNQIAILLDDYASLQDPSMTRSANLWLNQFDDTSSRKEEYGLILYTQPDKSTKALDDIYVEYADDKIVSYLRCSKKNLARKSIAQCRHHFASDNFWFRVRYDRDLLPDWKLIQMNVSGLVEEFKR